MAGFISGTGFMVQMLSLSNQRHFQKDTTDFTRWNLQENFFLTSDKEILIINNVPFNVCLSLKQKQFFKKIQSMS